MSPRNGYAVIDLETTGFGGTDRIIEIGIAFLSPSLELEGTWETLVQPNRDVSNSHVHKLTPTDLRDAPTWEEVAPEVARLMQGRIGVAHNASFEQRFLTTEFRRVGIGNNIADVPWVDTRVLASQHLGSGKLSEALVTAGITNDMPHAALPDALATAELLRKLQDTWGARPHGAPLAFTLDKDSRPRPRLVTRGDSEGEQQWIARIAQGLPQGGTTASARYREMLRVALADRLLTDAERRSLAEFARSADLTDADVAEIHEDFFRQFAVDAWLDGVLTRDEKDELVALADQLGIAPVVLNTALQEPGAELLDAAFALKSGDRIALTGSMDLPRETWEARALSYGLLTGGVTKKTVLVVAANPHSRSGKARRANELGIPIISEKHFATLLSTMETVVDDLAETVAEGVAEDLAGVTTENASETTATAAAWPEPPAAVEGPAQLTRFAWIDRITPRVSESALGSNEIASLWIHHYPAAPLLELSPLLTQDIDIDLSGSSARKAGILWADRFDPMLTATVEDLRDLPGVGAKRLENMVEAVVLAVLDAVDMTEPADPDEPADLALGNYAAAFADPYSYGDDAARADSADAVPGAEIDILRGWLALNGIRELPEGIKGAVPGAVKRCGNSDPLGPLFAHCAGELAAACAGDVRKQTIVSSRYMGNATLDEIGQTYGVTRERVRQLESQLKRDFHAPSTASAAVARALAHRILPFSRSANVMAQLPELAHIAEPFHGTYEQYFRMWNLWETDGEWITAPDFEKTFGSAVDALSDECNVVLLTQLAGHLNVDEALLTEWMRGRAGLVLLPDGEHVLAASNHQDRAVGVLSLAGKPLSAEDIVAALGMEINPRSLSNQLSVDGRVARVGYNLYALTTWGMEEFASINSWITSRIEASETGSVPLDELIADAPAFNVSENSVRAYATGSDFEVIDGMVTLSGAAPEILADDPQDYRDLYYRDGAWELLLTVTNDHLRGSGFQVPRGVPGIYRVPVGGEVAVPSRLGDQYVRVNKLKQSSTSTIRRFLLELGSEEGDRVWLRYEPTHFDVQPAPAAALANSSDENAEADSTDLPHLLDYMALDPTLANDPGNALHAINAALGLAEDSPRRRTVAVFRHRGQDQFADVVRGL